MALAIGYNVKQTNELMNSMATAYNDLGKYVNEQWGTVANTLKTNWIGEDELDYEKKLVERICSLYANSYTLVKNSIEIIGNLAQAWYDFQKNNSITGTAIETAGAINIEKPSVTPNEKIIEFTSRTISDSEDRGLKDTTSANTIKGALETFVTSLKSKTQNLFNMEANSAFFGDQATSIKAYIEKVGIAIAEVNMAVKDMCDALDKLANSQYTQASADAKTSFEQEATSVEDATTELGATRWS